MLIAKPIKIQIAHGNETEVRVTILMSVEKCAEQLNISLSQNQAVTLSDDLIEVYSHDSVEDITECLKNGRRGEYGFGHNSRNSLNMILIREWMSLHLEDKAIEREKVNKKSKMSNKEPLQNVDYEEYKIRSEKEDKEKKEEKQGSEEFNNFKAKYLRDRK